MVLVIPDDHQSHQHPYRLGVTLLCIGASFNMLGLADTYSDRVPGIRYMGVGLIAAGASLMCMAMCFWIRDTIHDPNLGTNNCNNYGAPANPVHMIAVDPSLEKPPDYSTVVDVPPCYEEAIKLGFKQIESVHTLKHVQALSQRDEASNSSSSKIILGATERCGSIQSTHSYVVTDLTDTDKSTENSSQRENSLTQVLRNSIRGISRKRSGSDDSNNPSNGLPEYTNTLEAVTVDKLTVESSKSETE